MVILIIKIIIIVVIDQQEDDSSDSSDSYKSTQIPSQTKIVKPNARTILLLSTPQNVEPAC